MQHAQISLKIWRLQYPADDPHQEAAKADPSADGSFGGKDCKDSADAAPEGRGAGVIDLNDGELAEPAAAFSASAKGVDLETHSRGSEGSEGSEGEGADCAQSMDAITARSRRGVPGPMWAIGLVATTTRPNPHDVMSGSISCSSDCALVNLIL
jgi:hypothetical protein